MGGLDCEVYLEAGKLNSKARPLNTVDRSRVWVIVGKSVRYRCFPPVGVSMTRPAKIASHSIHNYLGCGRNGSPESEQPPGRYSLKEYELLERR